MNEFPLLTVRCVLLPAPLTCFFYLHIYTYICAFSTILSICISTHASSTYMYVYLMYSAPSLVAPWSFWYANFRTATRSIRILILILILMLICRTPQHTCTSTRTRTRTCTLRDRVLVSYIDARHTHTHTNTYTSALSALVLVLVLVLVPPRTFNFFMCLKQAKMLAYSFLVPER